MANHGGQHLFKPCPLSKYFSAATALRKSSKVPGESWTPLHLDKRIREIYEWQLDAEYIHKKSVDLEDHSRRNNLRIDWIKERVGESWEDCEAEVEKRLREKLDTEDKIIIERAHRAKKKKKKNAKKISQVNQGQSSVVC